MVLVWKKDGSLRFCIDLRKLNNRMIKDAQSPPKTEDSRPLMAFSVGSLGFYECVQMPFGLTNAPATFQHLMESCLGNLHLKWCKMYLDDNIVFFLKNARRTYSETEGCV